MNSITLAASSGNSPFDSILRYDEKGNEWWSARDLQKMLGYAKWQMFGKSIQLGLENLESAIGDISTHALLLEVSFGKTNQKGQDYRLSRIACYHIALACDSRGKPNVKAAKHYFAVKTREAEAVIPVQNDRIRELELELKLLDRRETIYRLQPKAIADRITGVNEVQGEVKTRTVVVDQMGNVVNAGDTLTKTQIAHELGFINAKGKAETKQVAALVDEAIRAGAIPMPWRDERTVIATGFDAELLPKLKAFYQASPIQRQKWMGE